uniref:Uncharacterized protein n=1 Tax=Arundo donax TaxID=35708 RepID=A0A0A9FD13_ARUDO
MFLKSESLNLQCIQATSDVFSVKYCNDSDGKLYKSLDVD